MTTFSRGIRLVSCSVALAALVPLLSGCPKKGGDAADAEAEAAVAEVAEAAAPAAVVAAATNENDVSRFPDEKKLENVAATIQRQTNVREIPGIGKVVATLAKGGTVTEIAQRSTFFLVVFDNPKDSKRVMGWVSQDAFTAQADAGLKVVTCTAPENAIVSDNVTLCGKICTTDTQCPSGQACKGRANLFANGKIGDIVDVCTVFTPPTPKAVLPIADAAAAAPAAVVAIVPTPAGNVGAPVGGRCAPNFTLVTKDGQCHKNCATIGQCGADKCVICNGNAKVCANNVNFCK
jgi:predicted flap endonuclease-1-like 5' DNA nuclease